MKRSVSLQGSLRSHEAVAEKEEKGEDQKLFSLLLLACCVYCPTTKRSRAVEGCWSTVDHQHFLCSFFCLILL